MVRSEFSYSCMNRNKEESESQYHIKEENKSILKIDIQNNPMVFIRKIVFGKFLTCNWKYVLKNRLLFLKQILDVFNYFFLCRMIKNKILNIKIIF